ncbi:MAG: hypothetical protein ACP5NR_08510 [Athalassotoga sp.]|uniref:hypothetical protein n=1 Tax=Athalassotoga sp. TaxID=2022597 RepID=UPI003CFEDF01
MMEYKGKYQIVDLGEVKTYSLFTRPSEVSLENLIDLKRILNNPLMYDSKELRIVADAIIDARKNGKPVIVFSGAHAVKNGLSPIYNDLINRKIITTFASNGAFTIHDFELAISGKTSENVPHALEKGLFGFAEETNKYINNALIHGNKLKLGYGESIGRLMAGEAFPEKVNFPHKEISVQYNAFVNDVPFCAHCAIGDDIYHTTKYFDGEAIGGCSGRDFLIFANEVTKLTDGGVCLLIGSAVIGVEAYLKAFSIAANIGKTPNKIITADFDLREANISDAQMSKKDQPTYYFRDIKSIVVRIPNAFNGRGYYIKGDQNLTLPTLYKLIMEKI